MKLFHAKRLAKLINFLKTLNESQFNIYRWTNECNTVCCIGGWACQISDFKKAGLIMGGKSPYNTKTGNYCLTALTDFFGFTFDEGVRVFYTSSYREHGDIPYVDYSEDIKIKHAIIRIEQILKENGYVYKKDSCFRS